MMDEGPREPVISKNTKNNILQPIEDSSIPDSVALHFLDATPAPAAKTPAYAVKTIDAGLLIYDDLKEANSALKKHTGSRMRILGANDSIEDSFARLSIEGSSTSQLFEAELKPETASFPSVQPRDLNRLRRLIEAGNYHEVEETIWSNPKLLISCCDSAVYLMAGPKYNACHIAARTNKPDMMAMILVTVSNINFIKKLYPEEADKNLQDRVNHLLDSYLNTPDPRQGNTPLHFACKLGHYRVVRVLLTFEGCDIGLKDINGKTAEESADEQDEDIQQKIKDLFKTRLNSPSHQDQLRKRLLLAKKQKGNTGFSEDSFIYSPQKTA